MDDEAKALLSMIQAAADELDSPLARADTAGLRGSAPGTLLHQYIELEVVSRYRQAGVLPEGTNVSRIASEVVIDMDTGRIFAVGMSPGTAGGLASQYPNLRLRTVDIAIAREGIPVAGMEGERASDVIEIMVDFKTGDARLRDPQALERVVQAPVVALRAGGDVVGDVEHAVARSGSELADQLRRTGAAFPGTGSQLVRASALEHLQRAGRHALSALGPVGTLLGIDSAAGSAARGEHGSAALDLAGLIPGYYGDAVDAVRALDAAGQAAVTAVRSPRGGAVDVSRLTNGETPSLVGGVTERLNDLLSPPRGGSVDVGRLTEQDGRSPLERLVDRAREALGPPRGGLVDNDRLRGCEEGSESRAEPRKVEGAGSPPDKLIPADKATEIDVADRGRAPDEPVLEVDAIEASDDGPDTSARPESASSLSAASDEPQHSDPDATHSAVERLPEHLDAADGGGPPASTASARDPTPANAGGAGASGDRVSTAPQAAPAADEPSWPDADGPPYSAVDAPDTSHGTPPTFGVAPDEPSHLEATEYSPPPPPPPPPPTPPPPPDPAEDGAP